MVKVNITKSEIITNSAQFENQEQADAWIAQEVANNSWGKPERWVREDQEDVSQALDTRETQIGDQSITEYKLAAQYSISSEDVTDSIVQDARNQKLMQLRDLRDAKLKEVDVMINELVLGDRNDAAAIKTYRQELLTFTDDYRYANDPTRAKVAIDNVDLANVAWPEEP